MQNNFASDPLHRNTLLHKASYISLICKQIFSWKFIVNEFETTENRLPYLRRHFLYDIIAQRSTIKTLFIKLYFVFASNQNKTIHVTLKILCVRQHFTFVNEDTTPRRSTAKRGLFGGMKADVPRLATDAASSKKRGSNCRQ